MLRQICQISDNVKINRPRSRLRRAGHQLARNKAANQQATLFALSSSSLLPIPYPSWPLLLLLKKSV